MGGLARAPCGDGSGDALLVAGDAKRSLVLVYSFLLLPVLLLLLLLLLCYYFYYYYYYY